MVVRGPITLEDEEREGRNERASTFLLFGFALIFGLVVAIVPSFVYKATAKREHPERWYQEAWCMQRGGQTEFVLPNNTRVDCLLESHAVEFDFASKWAESLGQSLHYGMWTGRRSGIVLIIEDVARDAKYIERCQHTIEHYGLPITLWTMEKPAE